MGSVRDIAPDWLSFIRAEEWGITWVRPPIQEGLSDRETYIHHGAGGRYGTDHAEAMRRLQEWYQRPKHEGGRGYSTIGYDIMVHRDVSTDDVAVCGAREGWLSAATRDRNDIGEAICLFGYFHPGHVLSENPTERELEALAFAVAWSIEEGWSAPNTKVLGHRDNPARPGATGCPGDNLYPHVPSIGMRALDLLALANQESPTMITLPKPRRIYDTRKFNIPLNPGETRLIEVGSSISEVFVNVTCIGLDGARGHLSVNDEDDTTSVLNYNSDDRLECNGFPALTPNGQLMIRNGHGRAHLIVDLLQHR